MHKNYAIKVEHISNNTLKTSFRFDIEFITEETKRIINLYTKQWRWIVLLKVYLLA